MRDKNKKNNWSKTFSAIILAFMLVGIITYVFFDWIAPYYEIPVTRVRDFIIKLMPFLVGLILMVIGINLKVKKQRDFDEALQDRISNESLFALPDEEPELNKEKERKISLDQKLEMQEFDSVPQETLEVAKEEQEPRDLDNVSLIEKEEQEVKENQAIEEEPEQVEETTPKVSEDIIVDDFNDLLDETKIEEENPPVDDNINFQDDFEPEFIEETVESTYEDEIEPEELVEPDEPEESIDDLFDEIEETNEVEEDQVEEEIQENVDTEEGILDELLNDSDDEEVETENIETQSEEPTTEVEPEETVEEEPEVETQAEEIVEEETTTEVEPEESIEPETEETVEEETEVEPEESVDAETETEEIVEEDTESEIDEADEEEFIEEEEELLDISEEEDLEDDYSYPAPKPKSIRPKWLTPYKKNKPYESVLADDDPIIAAIDEVELSEDESNVDSLSETISLDTYEDFIKDSVESAKRHDYNYTVAKVSRTKVSEIEKAFDGAVTSYKLPRGNFIIEVPFYTEEETKAILDKGHFKYKICSFNKATEFGLKNIQDDLYIR